LHCGAEIVRAIVGRNEPRDFNWIEDPIARSVHGDDLRFAHHRGEITSE
jgi:hypothetical protein